MDKRPICFPCNHGMWENWKLANPIFIPDGIMKMVRDNHRRKMGLERDLISQTS